MNTRSVVVVVALVGKSCKGDAIECGVDSGRYRVFM